MIKKAISFAEKLRGKLAINGLIAIVAGLRDAACSILDNPALTRHLTAEGYIDGLIEFQGSAIKMQNA